MGEVTGSEEQPKSVDSKVEDSRKSKPGWSKERGILSSAQWAENELAQKELDNWMNPSNKSATRDNRDLDKTPVKPKLSANLPPFAPLKLSK